MPDLLGGFKLKGLDYVFNRVPVLAMRVALPGMPLEDGRSIGLFDTHQELAEGVVALIDDFESLNRRHEAAFEACAARFDWQRIGRRLLVALFRRLVETGKVRVNGALVTFEQGARTAWHTHPLGQTIIVTAGCGWVQREGGPVEEIRPGDVVWFSPGEKHWHGATATTAMTHIAIQEALNGKVVDWMEKVTDEQYQPRSSTN